MSYGVALVSADVTELADQEDEARQTERRLAAVFEQTQQFMALLDVDFKVLELNRWALLQSGLRVREVLGRHLWSIPWWEPYEAPLRERLGRALKGEAGVIEITYRGPRGETRVLDCSISPVSRSSSSEVELVVIQGFDQTERYSCWPSPISTRLRWRWRTRTIAAIHRMRGVAPTR